MAMSGREKVLAIVVAAVGGLLVFKLMIGFVFVGPLQSIDAQIESVKQEIIEKNNILEAKPRLIRKWRSLHKQTIAEDPEEAKRLLQSRINGLLAQIGLAKLTITPASTKTGKSASHYPVAVNLSGNGTLRQIVDFFDALYQEPYLMKVKSLMLNPQPKGETVGFTCRIEAIVLGQPELKIQLGEKPAVPPEPSKALVTGRYASIYGKNFFRPPAPPPPPQTVDLPDLRPEERPRPVVPPRDTGRPRPGDVVGTAVIGGTSGIYLRNFNGADWYKIGEQIHGRELVFVHPLGIVLRESTGKHLYVEVGDNVDRAQPLTVAAKMLPELYNQWRQANTQMR